MHGRWLAIMAAPAALIIGVTAVAASTAYPVDGTTAGKAIAVTNNGAATCNPQNPQQTSDYLCQFSVHGSYFEGAYMENGIYFGKVTVDYRTYNANTGCAQVSGFVTFRYTNGAQPAHSNDKLYATVDALNSTSCERSGNPAIHDDHLVLNVTHGTGVFSNATSGTLTSDGSDYPATNGGYNETAHFTGTVND